MNDLEQVEYLARHLMTEHGVGHLEFGFEDSTEVIARTRHRIFGKVWIPEAIFFSAPYALRLSMEQVREAILHEIAHALVPGEGHGPVWQAKAADLGIPAQAKMKSGISREVLTAAA